MVRSIFCLARALPCSVLLLTSVFALRCAGQEVPAFPGSGRGMHLWWGRSATSMEMLYWALVCARRPGEKQTILHNFERRRDFSPGGPSPG